MDIKEIRVRKKLTQKQLAELVGISQQHISKIETGLNIPSYATVKKIANALGYEIIWEEISNDRKTN